MVKKRSFALVHSKVFCHFLAHFIIEITKGSGMSGFDFFRKLLEIALKVSRYASLDEAE